MRRALSSLLVGGAAASSGGTIKLNWSDCGDSSTHGHITSLSPTSVVLGTKTSLAGKGHVDEAIQAATYKVVAKEGFIPVFSHSGDACKPETIKLPAGIGEIDMKGFKCPMSAGAVELDLDLSLSSAIPAKLARITIELTAQSSTGDKALCAKINTSPENLIADGENLIAAPSKEESEAEPTVDGGSIQLAWSDCGDSSTHGHITSLSPTSVVLGTKTSLVGKGKLDEAIQAATYKVVAKEGFIPVFSHSGDACKPETIKLPAGIGEIDMKGFKCPLSPGAVELDLDLSLSSAIPAKLARITIELTAQSSTGDKALCAKINTSPENMIA